MKLLVVSHLEHYRQAGRDVCAWPASAREIDVLAEEFGSVRHIAFRSDEKAPPSAVPYQSGRVELVPVSAAGGKRLVDKAATAVAMLRWARVIAREMRSADAMHIRTPSNIALAALAVYSAIPGGDHPAWIKYAGEWRGWAQEPRSFRFQRAWLRAGALRAAVTVNGEIDGEPAHVFSMPNPSFGHAAWSQAGLATLGKQLSGPIRLAFAGRFVPDKGPMFAIGVCEALRRSGLDTALDLAGDGPQRDELSEYIARRGLDRHIRLRGWLGDRELERLWRRAHFALLPTRTEGWPKALSEAMAFRAVPIATPVGAIPSTLNGCGVVLRRDDVQRWAAEIAGLAEHPGEWRRLADRAQQAAGDFTYENYLDRLRIVLASRALSEATA